jgi:hypothetical protein
LPGHLLAIEINLKVLRIEVNDVAFWVEHEVVENLRKGMA